MSRGVNCEGHEDNRIRTFLCVNFMGTTQTFSVCVMDFIMNWSNKLHGGVKQRPQFARIVPSLIPTPKVCVGVTGGRNQNVFGDNLSNKLL